MNRPPNPNSHSSGKDSDRLVLAKLTSSGLLAMTKQGRHRYYRLAGPAIARLIEQIMIVAGDDPAHPPLRGPQQSDMRTARTCYDHIAGRLGVGLADALLARKHVILAADGGEVTAPGLRFLRRLGVEPETVPGRRPFCRACLDWTERRPHLAGKIGTALAAGFLQRGWIVRRRGSRASSSASAIPSTTAGARSGCRCRSASGWRL